MALTLIRLLSGGRRFTHFWDRLELELHDACATELARDPSLDQNKLFVRLRDKFTLYPISLGHMIRVEINDVPSEYKVDGVSETGHRASARVPFSGSKVLLQTAPEPGYRFPFSGQETKAALKLHRYLPDMDAREFAADVKAELTRIKPVLAAFEKTVHAYDDLLRERVEDKIRSF